MKHQILFSLLALTILSCNNSGQQANKETPAQEETTIKGNGELKDGISDYTNNKKVLC